MIGGADLATAEAVGDDLGGAADLILQPVGDPLDDFLGIFGVLVLMVLDQFPVGGEIEQPVLLLRGQLGGAPEEVRGSLDLLGEVGHFVAAGPVADEDGEIVVGVGGIDGREGLAFAGDVEQVTHVDPALDGPAVPLDLNILLFGGSDPTEDRLGVPSQVHRQERGLDLPSVQPEKLVPCVSLLDLAVLGLAAGLLEKFLDIDAAAFGREDEVLPDLLDLG